MRLSRIAAVSAAAGCVSAFKDTSPFILFSSSQLVDSSSHIKASDDVATAIRVKEHVASVLHNCPSDSYVIVNQPGVTDSDFANANNAPYMQRRLSGEDTTVQTKHVISSVVGDLSSTHLAAELVRHCGLSATAFKGNAYKLPRADAASPQLLSIHFPSLPLSSEERAAELSKNDAYLDAFIRALPSDKYTVIYTTAPASARQYKQGGKEDQQKLYEMDEQFPEGMRPNHFKRDIQAYPRATNGSGNLDSNLPLFEKYTFLSSGIFMGGTVSLLLLLILYVGISAISGLQVSYYAFSKEFNPSAQKKQQ